VVEVEDIHFQQLQPLALEEMVVAELETLQVLQHLELLIQAAVAEAVFQVRLVAQGLSSYATNHHT
jgi:hypothetical protein